MKSWVNRMDIDEMLGFIVGIVTIELLLRLLCGHSLLGDLLSALLQLR